MNRKVGVLLSYLYMVFEVLSTLLLTPFILKTLGQAEYGVYKLSVALNSYLLLLDLGVGNAVTKYSAQFRVKNNIEGGRKFLGIASIYYFIISLITVVVGVVLVLIFPIAFAKGLTVEEVSLGQKLLAITIIGSIITLATTAYANTIIAYERFYISKGTAIFFILFRILGTYGALKLGARSIAIVTINLIITIITRLFYVLYVTIRLKLRPIFKNLDMKFAKEVFVYSSFILLQMIATQLNASVDQVLLGSLVVNSAVIIGIYGVGVQIVQYYQSIGSAFSNILMPGIVKLVENGASSKQLTKEMIRIGRIVLFVLGIVWMGFLISGKKFIRLWAGNENEDAFFVAFVLLTAYLFICVESIGTQILWAKNEHKEQSILKLVIVIANIVLTVFLIKWSPLKGATIGTFISLLVGDVGVMNYIFVKKIGINLLEYYKGLFTGSLLSILGAGFCSYIISRYSGVSWFSLLIDIIVLLIVYIILLFVFGMNNYEKNLLKNMFSKLLRKGNVK